MSAARAGRLVLVVGPSGAGKDTLIDAARRRFAGDSRFSFPQRIVSRPPSAAERNAYMPEAELAAKAAEGAFALHWQAHGHRYAIPGSVEAMIARGGCAVCNVSRTVVEEARMRFPALVIEVTASDQTLAARLAGRSRASDGDLSRRLARAAEAPVRADIVILNDGDLDAATDAFCRALEEGLGAGVAPDV